MCAPKYCNGHIEQSEYKYLCNKEDGGCPFGWRSKQRNVKGRLKPTMYMLDLKYRQRLLTAVGR